MVVVAAAMTTAVAAATVIAAARAMAVSNGGRYCRFGRQAVIWKNLLNVSKK